MKLSGREAIEFLESSGADREQVAFLRGEWRLGADIEIEVIEGCNRRKFVELLREGDLFDGYCAPSKPTASPGLLCDPEPDAKAKRT